MAKNKTMVAAGIITLFQAVGQIIYTGLGLAQYFCLIDFLRQLPVILFIKVLYFHTPNHCESRVNIGQSIEGMADQAFVLLTKEPLTVTRTFIINCISLGVGIIWFFTCIIIMTGGAENKPSRRTRWPWIITTVLVCVVDVAATVVYANDTFHTKTLADIMTLTGGTLSGTGNMQVGTQWASWIMVIIYSRLGVFFFINLFLLVSIIISIKEEKTGNNLVQVEASNSHIDALSERDDISLPSERATNFIPRPGLSQSFRRMKDFLFKKPSIGPQYENGLDSYDETPDRSPRTQHMDLDKKRTVNFPENLLSLPQRLENMIAEQQRRLDSTVIDTSGRRSPPRVSQSMPQLTTTSTQSEARGRRGTAAELQGQLPWAYIHASAHRMRDQLPPDEDLPPVPLPDYTAIQSHRKASVHRAASSLSSLAKKREYLLSRTTKPRLTGSDVLY